MSGFCWSGSFYPLYVFLKCFCKDNLTLQVPGLAEGPKQTEEMIIGYLLQSYYTEMQPSWGLSGGGRGSQ